MVGSAERSDPSRNAETLRCQISNPLQVLEGTETAYAALAARLEGRAYFHGDSPTAIDCLLFSHLSYHYRAPVVRSMLSGAC